MSKTNTNEFTNNKPEEKEKTEKVVSGSKATWFKRKLARFSKATGDFWVQGKQGFVMGSICGAILGFILGTYESIRAKSILPLPLSMITMACFFGGIMGVSTLIRTDNDKEIMFRVLYWDKNTAKLYQRDFRYIDKDGFFNKRI
jgi:hypothetical protein